MKRYIFLILVLFLANAFLVGCAGGSGSGGGNPPVNGNPVNPNEPEPNEPEVFDYVLRVTGAAGTQYAISLTANFGDADQVQFAPGIATLSASGDLFPIEGRNVLAQFVQRSNGNLTFQLFKDGDLIEQVSTSVDGQSGQFAEGL